MCVDCQKTTQYRARVGGVRGGRSPATIISERSREECQAAVDVYRMGGYDAWIETRTVTRWKREEKRWPS